MVIRMVNYKQEEVEWTKPERILERQRDRVEITSEQFGEEQRIKDIFMCMYLIKNETGRIHGGLAESAAIVSAYDTTILLLY